jgi:hypothetical protein
MTRPRRSWTRTVGPDGRTRSVPVDVARRVWLAEGGRCTFCNKNLLRDEVTGQEVMIGQLAHIVGWSTQPGSPRGADANVPVDERNTAENLMLVCGDQHQVIDHPSMWETYDAPTLRRLKRLHEETIQRLTSLRDNQTSTVLRVVGSIADIPVVLSRRTVAKAMLDRNLFPDYALLGYDAEIEVDLRGVGGEAEGTPLYWASAQARIATAGERIKRLVASGDVSRLSVFAIARIPLLVALGSAIGEAIPADLYPTRRSGEGGFGWTPSLPTARFAAGVGRAGGSRQRVAVVFSVSGPINPAAVDTAVPEDTTIYTVDLASGPPGVEAIASPESLDNFTTCWRQVLARIESEHPTTKAIEVFAAVPVTAAVAIGRVLIRGAHPPLRMHDLDRRTGRYEYALEVRR